MRNLLYRMLVRFNIFAVRHLCYHYPQFLWADVAGEVREKLRVKQELPKACQFTTV